MVWESKQSLLNDGINVFEINNEQLEIKDEPRFRNFVDRLVFNAVFNENDEVKSFSRWIIWEASILLNSPSTSIYDFYKARANNSWKDMTVPAINLRGMTYDVARIAFKVLNRLNACACIFEIARSEMDYTNQRPEEYVICILAAAIREHYKCPIFLQGDHYQVRIGAYLKDSEYELETLKKLIKESIEAGFYNIDIDTSTLVDLDQEEIIDQQRHSVEVANLLAKYIRENEPNNITISIGAEIGEIGKHNSTSEELSVFLEKFNETIGDMNGLSKMSIQTGSKQGGIPLSDGSIAKIRIDFETLEKCGEVARKEFGLGGVVQHGASTLPENAFDNFVNTNTLEVHLATGFQNAIFDSMAFPKGLKDQIHHWLDKEFYKEKKTDQTSEQFYYKTRKKSFGPFKKKFWELPDNAKRTLMSEVERIFTMMFKKLNIENSKNTVAEFIKPNPVHKKYPG